MPALAMRKMVLFVATFEPMAEFKKLTASLLTPTIKSENARINKMMTKTKNSVSMASNRVK
jgi:hypothetical protein